MTNFIEVKIIASKILSSIFLTLFLVTLSTCSETKKSVNESDQLLNKEAEKKAALKKYKKDLLVKHNAIDLDKVFEKDSSELTYSYKIEDELRKNNQFILARGLIMDIIKLNDTLFLLNCVIKYNKAKNEGGFYGEFKCNRELVSKIENLNFKLSDWVFLTIKLYDLKSLDFEVSNTSGNGDNEEYEINLENSIQPSTLHRAKGFCFDVNYNSKFKNALEY